MELTYTTLTPDLATQCAELEAAAFPHANPSEILSQADIEAYARTFPEGFFIALDGERVVGQGAGILLDFDFDRPQHSITGITGEHQCGNHDPDGAWYYGTDIVVHPEYRKRGIGTQLYELRKALVARLDKRGIVAGGYMQGFHAYKNSLTADEYIDAVRLGTIYDATLTFQMEQGFDLVIGLENYLDDEATDGWSALIVWENSRQPTAGATRRRSE